MAFKILKNPLSPGLSSMLPIALLIDIGAICYMAFAHLFGFYHDDGYLICAGVSQGAKKVHDVFAIDCPFRGYFVGWMYELIGLNPRYLDL
jgi:hypothetical protein